MKKTLLLGLALASTATLAQTPQYVWTQTYAGPQPVKTISDMKMDSRGFTYVCGTVGPSSGPTDAYVAKYSPSGTLVWQRTMNIANFGMSESFRRLVLSNDAVYAGGFMHTTVLTSSQDFFLAKLDLDGNPSASWGNIGRGVGVRYLDLGAQDAITDLALVGSDIVAAGNSDNANGNSDFIAYRYNTATGNPAAGWPTAGIGPGIRKYDSTGEDNCKRVRVDANGNVYLAGDIQSGTTKDFGVVKIASNGTFSSTWANNGPGVGVRRYDNPNNEDDTLADLEVSGSTVVLFGTSGDSVPDFRVVSYNSAGTIVANAAVGTTGTDTAQDGLVLSDGDFVITGNLGNDVGTVRFTSAGARSGDWPDVGAGPGIRRLSIFGGPSRGVKLATTIGNQIVVACRFPGSIGFDMGAIIYANDGGTNLAIAERTDDSDSPTALATDGTGRIYVAGNTGNAVYSLMHLGLQFGLSASAVTIIDGDLIQGSTANLYDNDGIGCDFFPDSFNLRLLIELTRVQPSVNQAPAMVTLNVSHFAERLGLAWNVKALRRSTNTFVNLAGGVLTGTDVSAIFAFHALGEDLFDATGRATFRYEAAPINDEDPSQDGWLIGLDQVTLRYFN